MKTDIPLKRLTQHCPSDLLPLIGAPTAEVLGIMSVELPTTTTSLDTLLRLRKPGGSPYYHLIEWQGYRDERFLWRVLGYLSWLGQHYEERPLKVTLVYLKPNHDVGTMLDQRDDPPERGDWSVAFQAVRLWEHDAAAALGTGLPGLVSLMPLMQGATAAMVEQAAQHLISHVAPPIRGDLLVVLGVFAEPLLGTTRFLQLVTKEYLMESDLISLLVQDAVQEQLATVEQERAVLLQQNAALEQEKETLEQEKETLEQEKETLEQRQAMLMQQRAELNTIFCQTLQQVITDLIQMRFPVIAPTLLDEVKILTEVTQLQRLYEAVRSAPDQATAEQCLRESLLAHNRNA